MKPCLCLFEPFHQPSEYLLGNLNNSVVHNIYSIYYDHTVEPHYNGHLEAKSSWLLYEVAFLLSGIQNHHN